MCQTVGTASDKGAQDHGHEPRRARGAHRAVRAGTGADPGGARQGAEGGALVAPGSGEVERPRGGGPLRRLGDQLRPAHPHPDRREGAPHRRLRPGRLGAGLRLSLGAARGRARGGERGARPDGAPAAEADRRRVEQRRAGTPSPAATRPRTGSGSTPPTSRATRSRSSGTWRHGRRARRHADRHGPVGCRRRHRGRRAARGARRDPGRARARAGPAPGGAPGPRPERPAGARPRPDRRGGGGVAQPRRAPLPPRRRVRWLRLAAHRVPGAAAEEDGHPRRAAAQVDGQGSPAGLAHDRDAGGRRRHALALPAEGRLRLRPRPGRPRHGPLRPRDERRGPGRGVSRARRSSQPNRLRPARRASRRFRPRGWRRHGRPRPSRGRAHQPRREGGGRHARRDARRPGPPGAPARPPRRRGEAGGARSQPARPAGALAPRARVEEGRGDGARQGGGARTGLPRLARVLLPDERGRRRHAGPAGGRGAAGRDRPARARSLQRRRALRAAPRAARPLGHRGRGEPQEREGRGAQPPPERRERGPAEARVLVGGEGASLPQGRCLRRRRPRPAAGGLPAGGDPRGLRTPEARPRRPRLLRPRGPRARAAARGCGRLPRRARPARGHVSPHAAHGVGHRPGAAARSPPTPSPPGGLTPRTPSSRSRTPGSRTPPAPGRSRTPGSRRTAGGDRTSRKR